MIAPRHVAPTTVDTLTPVETSTVAAAHAATALVDAVVQPRVMDASAATTIRRKVAANTADKSASPPLEVSTVDAAHAAKALVDAAIQPRKMDASAATNALR